MANSLAPVWTPTPPIIDDEMLDDTATPPADISRDDLWRALMLERAAHKKLRAAYRAMVSDQKTMPGITPSALSARVADLSRRHLHSALAQLVDACSQAVQPPAYVAQKIKIALAALEWDRARGGEPG